MRVVSLYIRGDDSNGVDCKIIINNLNIYSIIKNRVFCHRFFKTSNSPRVPYLFSPYIKPN